MNGVVALLKRNKSRDLQMFTFSEIQEATNNFLAENKLGEGGFGPVYKVSHNSLMFVTSRSLISECMVFF